MSSNQWQRSRLAWSDAHTIEGDWTLLSSTGETMARIYDAGRDNGFEPGSWRWRVYREGGLSIGGSAESGKDAREECEKNIAIREGRPSASKASV